MQPLLTIQGPEAALFWILAPLSVAAALGMLLVKKAVHSALLLAWVMITLAIFYIAQDAAFLGVVQVIVYTGAVMMLFLFILMLVGVHLIHLPKQLLAFAQSRLLQRLV